MSATSTSTVTGKLTYFQYPVDGSKPYYTINLDSKTGARDKNWVEEPHHVELENMRETAKEHTLDSSGFLFGKQPSTHTSFDTDEEITREYYPEVSELVKKITGASRVHPFDHSKCSERLSGLRI